MPKKKNKLTVKTVENVENDKSHTRKSLPVTPVSSPLDIEEESERIVEFLKPPILNDNDRILADLKESIQSSESFAKGAFGEVYKFVGQDCVIKISLNSEANNSMYNEINIISELEKLRLREKTDCSDTLINFCSNEYKYAFDLINDNVYLSLKYISPSLLEVFKNPEDYKISRLDISNGLSKAIKCLHGWGIIHRDLKPANILLRRLPGGNAEVVIIDFGSAACKPMGEGNLKDGTIELLKFSSKTTILYQGPPLPHRSINDDNDLFNNGCFYDLWSILLIITEMVLEKNVYKLYFEPEWGTEGPPSIEIEFGDRGQKLENFKNEFINFLTKNNVSQIIIEKWKYLIDYASNTHNDIDGILNILDGLTEKELYRVSQRVNRFLDRSGIGVPLKTTPRPKHPLIEVYNLRGGRPAWKYTIPFYNPKSLSFFQMGGPYRGIHNQSGGVSNFLERYNMFLD